MNVPWLNPDGAEVTMACPVCNDGFGNVHIEPDTETDPGDSTVSANDTIVRLRFWCENSHRFALDFRFHKGDTFVFAMKEETVYTPIS